MNLRRHSVAMNVPPRLQMSEKLATGGFRKVHPDGLRMGTHPIHNVAPVAAARLRLLKQLAEPAQQRHKILA
jgi:hypothetical protein